MATQVSIEGKRYWMLSKDVAELTATEPVEKVVRLLPAFDQWVVCASRRVPALVEPKYHQRIYRLQGWVSPVLIVSSTDFEFIGCHIGDDTELQFGSEVAQPIRLFNLRNVQAYSDLSFFAPVRNPDGTITIKVMP